MFKRGNEISAGGIHHNKRALAREKQQSMFQQVRHKPWYIATEKSLKFQILKDEASYYGCKKNNGADQLCSYC